MVVAALYSHFEEKQRAQISDLVRIAFTECDESIRAGSHRIELISKQKLFLKN